MPTSPLCLDASSPIQSQSTDYLRIEPFISEFVSAQALHTAIQLGLTECLAKQACSQESLKKQFHELHALPMLLQQLKAAGVITNTENHWILTEAFKHCLPYKDLLKAKLEFANLLAPDLLQHYELFLKDFPSFIQQAKVFELFAYERCFHITEENIKAAQRWMRFTTCLTRYEGRVIADNANLQNCRTHLDIGGNSGELALQLCKRNTELRSTIIDLPVVCEVGKKHTQNEPESNRINFIAADALNDPLPLEQDLITFKSILHDWPLPACERFLNQAANALKESGQIIICERGPLDLSKPVPYGLLPMLLFNRSFRSAEHYLSLLYSIGFKNCTVKEIQLETPFFMIAAKRS